MRKADRYELECIAKALIAYSDAAEANKILADILARVPVPGGYSIREYAMKACGVSARNPRQEFRS